MPEPEYRYKEYYSDTDLYTSVYEQYYFKNTKQKRIKPLKQVKKRKKSNAGIFRFICMFMLCFVLMGILRYSFKSFVADTFPENKSKMLNVDYEKMMYPTHRYLYKDLFLGKYIIKDTKYSRPLMTDLKERAVLSALRNKLTDLSLNYKKIEPSVYVYDYSNQSYVDIGADRVFPAASIIKLPVLVEMFRQIESGKFSLYDTMVLQDYFRASGSGKLQYSQGGVAHTMDYLAKIMIENSDNSSTNMIMAKMGGMSEVNKAIRRWGLKYTRVNNWLPDLDGTNVTTARELAKILYNVDNTNILSVESKRHIAEYMSHVKNNRLLQAGLPQEAVLLHKTGDIGFMLGDAGIVKSPTGKKYIVVILAKRPYNNLQGKEFIVNASKIIYNHISQ